MLSAFEKIRRISLICKLVPAQYREYEYGLFTRQLVVLNSLSASQTLFLAKCPQKTVSSCIFFVFVFVFVDENYV